MVVTQWKNSTDVIKVIPGPWWAGHGQVPREHIISAASCLCRRYLWLRLGSSIGLTGKPDELNGCAYENEKQGPYHPADLPELLLAWAQKSLLETGRSGCRVMQLRESLRELRSISFILLLNLSTLPNCHYRI